MPVLLAIRARSRSLVVIGALHGALISNIVRRMTEARSVSCATLLGVVSVLGLAALGCSEDACEGLVFEPPPVPNPGADAPPTVLAGEWIAGGVLELQFSKPLTSNGDLDPQRFALVSYDALTSDYGDSETCILRTRYRSLGTSYIYDYSIAPAIAAVWIAPEDPTRLRLRLSSLAAQCTTRSGSIANGLLLTYTNAPSPNPSTLLLDGEGVPVPDIGPAWAITTLDACFDASYCSFNDNASGHLPALNSLAEIPCPV
jgi:hypothetical protein